MNTQGIGRFLVLALGVMAFQGCELVPPPAPGTPEGEKAPAAAANGNPDMAQFLEIANRSVKEWDITSASLLASKMARSGPNGADPLLDLLADPSVKGETKVLVTMVMVPMVRPPMIPRLIAMTQPGQNISTRSCATQLLGMVENPEAAKRTRELLHDPELRVQFAAVYCLMRDDDPEAIQLAVELWKRPDLELNQRVSLVQVIPLTRAVLMTPICREAALDTKLDPNARVHAVEVLVKAGTEDVMPVLQQCAQSDPEPRLRDFAKAGLDSLQAGKLGGNATSVPPSEPTASAPTPTAAPASPAAPAEAPAAPATAEAPASAPAAAR